MSSEVVEVGDSGLSCFKTTSILFCLLLLVLLRIASIEKQPKLLFSPIFFLEQISSSWKSTYLQLDSYLGANPFIANPSLPVRAERDSNKWSEERTSGACRCPQLYRMTRTTIHTRVNHKLAKAFCGSLISGLCIISCQVFVHSFASLCPSGQDFASQKCRQSGEG